MLGLVPGAGKMEGEGMAGFRKGLWVKGRV